MKMKRLEEIEAELKKPSTHASDLRLIVELCRGVRELHAQLKVAQDEARAHRETDQAQRALAAETAAQSQRMRADELENRVAEQDDAIRELNARLELAE